MSWQSPSSSVQCRHSDLLYSGMSVGTGATVITRVVTAMGAGGNGVVVGVAVRVGGAVVAVGAVVGPVDPGTGFVGAGDDVAGSSVGVGVAVATGSGVIVGI